MPVLPGPHHLIPDAPLASYAEYLELMGGSAVVRARDLGPDAVLAEVTRSGLRGRGGAGFPTGTKWSALRAHPCPTRSVVCNAAEGEPGTFKDRWLLRHNPYAALEGMLVAAHVIDARDVVIALKASFSKERQRLEAAVDELRAANVLSHHEVRIVAGPEEYLFGEEKALLEVCEGNDPLPREPHYPPYEKGLFATSGSPNPALVNNVETLAHVPSIVRDGGASFRAVGTADTPGTILFTVSGDVKRPGVYEMPAGITLAELFGDVAGGPLPGRSFKAALCGVSAPPIAAARFDARADFGSLHLVGGALGSAGFHVLDDSRDMARVAQAIARFLYVESCNQCSACKHGLRLASTAIDELFDARTATPDDFERALYGARSAPQGNRCYLPVQGASVVPSIMLRWRAELDERLKDPSGGPGPFLIPKIVDYDPTTSSFTYDLDQPRKRPDWTFDEPAPPSVRPARAPSPGTPHRAPASVRLAPDVRDAIGELAAGDPREVERLVNEALRAYAASRRSPSA